MGAAPRHLARNKGGTRREGRRERKIYPGEGLPKFPNRGFITLMVTNLCQSFNKANYGKKRHNLFLTSAAQLTNDSKAFYGVTDPTCPARVAR